MLGEFSGYSWHVGWTPGENFPVLAKEFDERYFLCRAEACRYESSLRGVRRVNLVRSGVFAGVELCFGCILSRFGEDVMIR